jgi:hypothetical protein
MIEIQNASASDADRDDNKLKSKAWHTVAYGIDYKEACMDLIRAINDEEVNTEDGWLRIVNTATKEVICL